MASSTNKTKDWFKNQLISYGVALPSSSAKKEEYQRLYEEQVLPQQNNTEFSSDDDTEQPSEVVQPRAPSMPKSSRVETSKQAGGTDFAEWVNRMSDKNLFDALTACEKTPGPIVDSTRDFYRKMLLDTLKETPDLTMRNIEVYLSENPDIIWEAGGVSVNGTNGVTTNGKSENGFSDSDDEEHVETASRASRSSRASSKRATPARTPRSPVKPIVNPPTPVSAQASSKLETESRRTARAVRENIFSSVDADYKLRTQDDDQLMNRLASPGTSRSSPYIVRKRVVESYEENRTFRDFTSETDSGLSNKNRNDAQAAPRSRMRTVLFILLLLIIIGVGCGVFLHFNQLGNNQLEEIQDELDILLKQIVIDEGNLNGDVEGEA